jgi:outer membrane autotransporter protein
LRARQAHYNSNKESRMTISGRNARVRAHRQPRLASTTRAIRNALTLSAAALAFSGSGVAFAQSCEITALHEVTCNGAFTDDVANTVPVVASVPDLTLVVGDDDATTVNPGYGTNGITSAWGGDATVINYAEINTGAADGIRMYSDDSATLGNFGEIYTYTGANNAYGIDVDAFNDATVTNAGSVDTHSFWYTTVALDTQTVQGDATVVNQAGAEVSAYSFIAGAVGVVGGSTWGDVSVDNAGSVSAYSFLSTAIGVSTGTNYGDDSVTNSGAIDARSFLGQGQGVAISAEYGEAYFGNTEDGEVSVHAYNNIALGASLFGASAEVVNAGSIEVHGGYLARGVIMTSFNGDSTLDNDGTIQAYASWLATGALVQANGDHLAQADNSGEIYAFGSVTRGLIVNAYDGSTHTDNSGSIEAHGFNGSYGIDTHGKYDVSVDNSGTVTAYTQFGSVRGINAVSQDTIEVYNSGSVDVESAYGYALGVAVNSSSPDGSVLVDNSGKVDAEAAINGWGVLATSNFGSIDLDNSGTITVDGGQYATGIEGSGVWADVAVENSGSVHASSGYGNANGIYAHSVYYSVDVDNSGKILAESSHDDAWGVFVTLLHDSAEVTNSGTIDAYGARFGTGIDVRSAIDADIAITNSGDVYTSAGTSSSTGIFAASEGSGTIEVVNSGGVHSVSDTFALAISVRSLDGDIHVDNSGNVLAEADANTSKGIRARSYGEADILLESSGTVAAYAEVGGAQAIYAASRDVGDIEIQNSGTVHADGYNYSIGIAAFSDISGNITIGNDGSVYAYSEDYAWAIGANTYGSGGDVSIRNTGSAEAQSRDRDAFAVHSNVAAGNFYLYNDDALTAESENGNAAGVDGHVVIDEAYAEVVNAGSISALSHHANATGVALTAAGDHGIVSVDNDGSIGADAYYGQAIGVYASAFGLYGESTVTVGENGSVSASSGYFAQGVVAAGGKYAGIVNAGDISAVASNEADAYAFALGASVSSFYGEAYLGNSGTISALAEGYAANATGAAASIYGGNATVDNSGTIDATATGDIAGRATGVNASSSLLSATVNNAGTIEASASGDYADATGAYVTASEGALVYTTDGSLLEASATGGTDADATGASVKGLFANVYGEGAISATATADLDEGDARAYGADVYGNFTGIYVLGDGAISATAEGAYALAVGALQDGYFTAFRNEGSIEASATGDTGFAIGAMTLSYYGVHMSNDGDIAATGSGEGVQAVGAFAYSRYGDVALYNTGSIEAEADLLAVAVQLKTNYATVVENSGTIAASGAEDNVAVYATESSTDYIYNDGVLAGALWLGTGDDYLDNGEDGVWYAGQTATDFGDGDDRIVNDGTIVLEDSVIDLGYHDVAGNQFYNYGFVVADGDNLINMGNGPVAPLVPSLNPYAFYNGGAIDFQDGEADDTLTIVGDFAGDGDINVDVSGLGEASDVLYIDGSVVTGTVGTINVDLVDLPESIESLVPMVYVSGDSVAGNFVLGDVSWDEENSFVTLDFDLVADIDATNADPDVFALGIEVTGLSDPGVLAANVAGSVQSLMNSQVGTWRQRMGVIDRFTDGAVALWARVFQDKGGFSPEHHAANFGDGGNFDWDQKNSGIEAGIDFAVSDEFSLGLLVGQSKADTHLDSDPATKSDIDADTWGIYGTWISPTGFYLDASYRWMSFDVDMNSVAGNMDVDGDAESFNLELGYAWTLSGGLKIEPQLQYTKTNVDELDLLETSSGMTFRNDGGESSRGRLGVSFRKGFGEADAGWLWTPYLTISAVREFDGENLYAINDVFHGETDLEGTSTLLELGFTARHQNWSVYGGLNWQDGGAVNSFFGGQLGVRYTFGGQAPAPAPVAAPPPAKTCADLDDDGDGVNNCDDKCLGSTAGEAVGADGCPVPAPQPEPEMAPKPFRG